MYMIVSFTAAGERGKRSAGGRGRRVPQIPCWIPSKSTRGSHRQRICIRTKGRHRQRRSRESTHRETAIDQRLRGILLSGEREGKEGLTARYWAEADMQKAAMRQTKTLKNTQYSSV